MGHRTFTLLLPTQGISSSYEYGSAVDFMDAKPANLFNIQYLTSTFTLLQLTQPISSSYEYGFTMDTMDANPPNIFFMTIYEYGCPGCRYLLSVGYELGMDIHS